MSHLKNESVNRCFSLLREYIDESPLTDKKKSAALALDQLHKVTAGSDPGSSTPDGGTFDNSGCNAKPRAYGNTSG